MTGRKRQRRWAVARIVGFSLWMAIVSLILLWQRVHYEGFMALVGEWQYDVIGREYVTFNYVFLVFILCLPGYLLFLRPMRVTANARLPAATFRSARALLRAILATALGLAVAAVVILVAMLFLPSVNGTMQQIDVSRPMSTPPEEGPTTLSGTILYDSTAGLDEDMLLVRRSFRFAPVVGAGQANPEIEFFVQFAPVDVHTRSGPTVMTGVLKREGLPGELVRLFRYAGFRVADPHYVLFAEPAAMRWPYLSAIVQLLIGAVFALIVGLLQGRRVRRIDHLVHSRDVEGTATP